MKWYSILLAPFALIYWVVVAIRNFLFDKNILKSFEFDFPVIVLGNLEVGGTGKTPHTIYTAELLAQNGYQVQVLSRGYKRKKSGFVKVNNNETPESVGDEPYLMYKQLKHRAQVYVCENRVLGIIQILKDAPETDVVVLDDAFQHRALKAGFNILLTTAAKPFYKNYILPIGSLRDRRSSVKRAQHIIVAKASDDSVAQQIHEKTDIHTSTSKLTYQTPTNPFGEIKFEDIKKWVVVTGIAQPQYLVEHIEKQGTQVKLCQFPDHHQYSEQDIQKVQKIFDNLADEKKGIVTTAKDWVKIAALVENTPFKQYWFVQDLTVTLDPKNEFDNTILAYVSANKRDNSVHPE